MTKRKSDCCWRFVSFHWVGWAWSTVPNVLETTDWLNWDAELDDEMSRGTVCGWRNVWSSLR